MGVDVNDTRRFATDTVPSSRGFASFSVVSDVASARLRPLVFACLGLSESYDWKFVRFSPGGGVAAVVCIKRDATMNFLGRKV